MRVKFFVLTFLVSFLFVGCKHTTGDYQVTKDPKKGDPMLVGKIDRSALLKYPFDKWFKQEYESYVVDTDAFAGVNLPDFTITIVFATWCPDSRMEVPRMLKILDYLFVPDKDITLYCVDRDKKAGKFDISNLNIERVPTFIFYVNGKEKGRIIEHPQQSLEKDMHSILLGQ